MTRAIVATAFGGPEVLELVDVAVGPPGPGEVIIDVRAAGTNPVDRKLYSGNMGADPAKLPMRLGFEAAGVVSQVGEDAQGPAGPVRPEDDVIAYRITGAYAEQVRVPAANVFPKPATLDFPEASGLMLAGVTAVHALTATGVGPGDTVLVHGASGGVGLMTVQLAVAAGARVIGTASQARHAYLRELGAEPLVYGDGLEERIRGLATDGVNAAIDTVGTDEAVDVSFALVADRDRIVTIAASQRGAEAGIRILGGAPGADPGTAIRDAARLELVRQAAAGTLRVLVAAAFPLEDAAEAHRLLATGHARGKVVLLP
jgi:NADPH:quinone reductase-like Zn-dependent oxidoreductase